MNSQEETQNNPEYRVGGGVKCHSWHAHGHQSGCFEPRNLGLFLETSSQRHWSLTQSPLSSPEDGEQGWKFPHFQSGTGLSERFWNLSLVSGHQESLGWIKMLLSPRESQGFWKLCACEPGQRPNMYFSIMSQWVQKWWLSDMAPSPRNDASAERVCILFNDISNRASSCHCHLPNLDIHIGWIANQSAVRKYLFFFFLPSRPHGLSLTRFRYMCLIFRYFNISYHQITFNLPSSLQPNPGLRLSSCVLGAPLGDDWEIGNRGWMGGEVSVWLTGAPWSSQGGPMLFCHALSNTHAHDSWALWKDL